MKISKEFVWVVTVLTALFSTFLVVESRYAKAADTERLTKRLDIIEYRTLYHNALDNLYYFRKQLRKYPKDQELKEKVEKTEKEVKELEKEILSLKDSMRGKHND